MATKYDRRDFLKFSSAVGAGLVLGGISTSGCQQLRSKSPEIKDAPIDTVRIGFVGVGSQGSAHVRNFLNIEGVEVRAVCDIVEERVTRMQRLVVEAGQAKPVGYYRGKTDFKRMCETEELDLVFTATPWNWHVPVCVAAMKTGKHAATEVPAAVTLDECWQLVETSEKTRRHCVMMENCCYDRTELMILNMVRKGLLGELLHAEAGYLHDLRWHKFDPYCYEGMWRIVHSIKRDGNLYPTHGLGPVAQCMNINRGDRFDYLVSMSSKSIGLNLYAAEKFGPNSRQAKQKYALGDVNTSLIRTVKGRTIILKHDCNSPRPYSRDIVVQGTKGIVRKYPEQKIHIEGTSKPHTWEPLENYAGEYGHPLWKALVEKAEGGGHGGMDYIEDYRLIEALRTGTPPDMDVYDAASWSVVSELSERSVAKRGRSVDFPDFTRGKWKTNPPLGIIGA